MHLIENKEVALTDLQHNSMQALWQQLWQQEWVVYAKNRLEGRSK